MNEYLNIRLLAPKPLAKNLAFIFNVEGARTGVTIRNCILQTSEISCKKIIYISISRGVERTGRRIDSELHSAARTSLLGGNMYGKPTIIAKQLANVGVHPCL